MPSERLADTPGTLAATAARGGELLREPLLAQQALRFERVEHALERIRPGAARGEPVRELAAGMLPAPEQSERPLSQLRVNPGGQAPIPSPARSAARLREGRSRSRNAVSIVLAISLCSLRKSRTLSFPWPMRSPP